MRNIAMTNAREKQKTIHLTGKELDVMEILWKSDRPLTAADIRQLGTVNPNTIAVCLRTLLKKNAIKVADIVYSNTVLARSYVPVLERDAYWADCYRQSAGDGNTMQLVRQFVSDSEDIHEIEQLEKLIEAKKKELLKK